MNIDEEIIKERILNGEFSNETIKYMTDEEKSNILLKEQEELDNKGDIYERQNKQ